MQKHSSANTCVRTVNSVYTQTKYPIPRNALILDYGGGRFNDNQDYVLKKYNSKLFVFDKFNRTKKHNDMVMDIFSEHVPDLIVCSNVLNVIDDDATMEKVVADIKSLCGKNTQVLFAIYQGDKTGKGKVTKKDCYQRNERTDSYVPLIRKYFRNVERWGLFISAF